KTVLLDEDGETVPGARVGSDRGEVFVPYYEPRLFPIVIRKNVSGEDGLFGSSDCEVIRPQQQGINKLESRIMEKLLLGGVFPIVPENFRETLDNSIFRRMFRASAANAKIFSRLDLQADITGDAKQSERLYDQAKRILGISDSFQGMTDTTAQSGKAKEIQIAQAAGRLCGKKQMKRAAYAEMDKILFSYYLAYADEVRTTGENEAFDRFDFVVCDGDGNCRYCDDFLFDEVDE
ncbi:MAG: hypothetical protein KBS76_03030, partial [Ruminococcus sp.]|nr:hypothetical protein [Candidatus Apopatosoma intestinale]